MSDGGREQQLQHQACERCWKRKQKCDRLLPSCTACGDLSIPCIARKQEWVPSKSTQVYVSSYVDSLKRKVEHLETQRKRQRIQHVNPLQSGLVPESGLQHDPEQGATPRLELSQTVDNNDSSVHATMGEIGLLSLGAMAEAHNQAGEFPRHLALERVITAALSVDGSDPSTSKRSNSPSSGISAMQESMSNQPIKLKRDFTSPYVDIFMEEVGIGLPYLDRINIMEQYEAVMEVQQMAGPVQASTIRDFNVHLFVATGMTLSLDSSRLQLMILNLHSAATKMLPEIIRNGDDLATIHCLLSLIIFSIFSSHGGSTWHLIALTTKRCVSLRLHKEPDTQAGLSDSEMDSRRRAFWSLYLLDRALSSVLDRPFSIQDEDITLRLPREFQGPERVALERTFTSHLIAQARLISDMRTNKPQQQLFNYSNLCFWGDFPPRLRHLMSLSPRVSDQLEQLYCRTLLQVVSYRREGPIPTWSTFDGQSSIESNIVQSCIRFINQLHDRFDHAHFAGSFLQSYDIFSAGVTIIRLVFSSKVHLENSLVQTTKIVSKCSTLLTVIGERFPALKVLRRILWALSSRAMEGSSASDADILHNLPSIVPRRIRKCIEEFLNSESDTIRNEISTISGR